MMQIIKGKPNVPHRWAKEIKAWADGALIQWRYAFADVPAGLIADPDNSWRDFDGYTHEWPNWNNTTMEFRVASPAPEPLTPAAGEPNLNLAWACERWRDEVQYRPLVNVHRRTLDHTWRQVIRHFGGNPVELLGPPHDELLAAMPAVDAGKRSPPESMGPWTGGTTWAALPTEKQGD